jgi:two-component system, LytTR family, response regulator
MKKITAVIVDDERLARVNLKKLLESYEAIDIVGEADSCASAVSVILKFRPRLIFLDIQLIGESGFDLLEQLDSDIHVIFVTAFDQYAIRAFEVNAIDYILKPVNPERLKKAVDRLTDTQVRQIPGSKFNYDDLIFIRQDNHTSKFLKISSIVSIKSAGNYTELITTGSRRFLVLKTLKQWMDELPHENFIQVHRSVIVNLTYIKRIEKNGSGRRIYLNDSGDPVEVSRRYLVRLKSRYKI